MFRHHSQRGLGLIIQAFVHSGEIRHKVAKIHNKKIFLNNLGHNSAQQTELGQHHARCISL